MSLFMNLTNEKVAEERQSLLKAIESYNKICETFGCNKIVVTDSTDTESVSNTNVYVDQIFSFFYYFLFIAF